MVYLPSPPPLALVPCPTSDFGGEERKRDDNMTPPPPPSAVLFVCFQEKVPEIVEVLTPVFCLRARAHGVLNFVLPPD